jgi:sterol desaturase/sphingolipid hydroxylase (fatty acid hydroxylase superfamily)
MLLEGPAYWLGLPLFVSLVLLELAVYWWKGGSAYTWGESLGSIGVAVGNKLLALIKIGVTGAVTYFVWDHRISEIPLNTACGLLGVFLGVEFAYYWFHRLSHEIRWMWATHAVHHSAEHLNVLAAYRLGWTSFFSGAWLLFMPLVWIGFHPAAVFATLALNLLYQSWIHTDLIPKLGWLEYVLNTPSNHRVHHATNADYLDRNYGGILILYDRLFGTFVEERDDQPCKYGLVKQVSSHNPVRIALHEWIAMGRDALTARSLRDLGGYLFGPPGWRPDGRGNTSEVIRMRWRAENIGGQAVPAMAQRVRPRQGIGVRVIQSLVVVALLGGGVTAYVMAQVPANVRTACVADYKAHCSSVVPGGGRIAACMRAHENKLSQSCTLALGQVQASAALRLQPADPPAP